MYDKQLSEKLFLLYTNFMTLDLFVLYTTWRMVQIKTDLGSYCINSYLRGYPLDWDFPSRIIVALIHQDSGLTEVAKYLQ